jgi:hypothetical protein
VYLHHRSYHTLCFTNSFSGKNCLKQKEQPLLLILSFVWFNLYRQKCAIFLKFLDCVYSIQGNWELTYLISSATWNYSGTGTQGGKEIYPFSGSTQIYFFTKLFLFRWNYLCEKMSLLPFQFCICISELISMRTSFSPL